MEKRSGERPREERCKDGDLHKINVFSVKETCDEIMS